MVEMTAPQGPQGKTVFERAAGDVELRTEVPRDAAVVRVEGPAGDLPVLIGPAFGEVAGAMGQAGVGIAGEPFTRYLAWDGGRVEAEVGFPVLRPAPAVGRVYPTTLPGGEVASIVHVGPYDTLHETYAQLQAWLGARGWSPTGPMWEVYWSEPVGDPSTWRTEICWPVSRA